ncbi:hypothetical protein GCM10020001_090510 [Nonomuraea salmonea]
MAVPNAVKTSFCGPSFTLCAEVSATGRLPVSVSTFMASALVMKSMYAAAASGCGLFAVTANGSPVPPVATGAASAAAPGGSMKPRSEPSALSRSASSQVPAIRNTPWPLPNACQDAS